MLERPVMSIKYPLAQDRQTLTGPYRKLDDAFS